MIPTVTLAPGYVIPRLIKGGWQLAGGHGAVRDDEAMADMFAYAEAGITAFDCADIYTGVEERIGAFLRAWWTRHGETAPRIRVHTKCVPDLDALPTLMRGDLERLIDRSRARLGRAHGSDVLLDLSRVRFEPLAHVLDGACPTRLVVEERADGLCVPPLERLRPARDRDLGPGVDRLRGASRNQRHHDPEAHGADHSRRPGCASSQRSFDRNVRASFRGSFDGRARRRVGSKRPNTFAPS